MLDRFPGPCGREIAHENPRHVTFSLEAADLVGHQP